MCVGQHTLYVYRVNLYGDIFSIGSLEYWSMSVVWHTIYHTFCACVYRDCVWGLCMGTSTMHCIFLFVQAVCITNGFQVCQLYGILAK